VRSAGRNSSPIRQSTENTARKNVMGSPAERRIAMTTEKIQRLSAYRCSIALFRKLFSDGIITDAEFRRTERIIAEKCGLSLYSIYREIP
jgi:hypothetical protein